MCNITWLYKIMHKNTYLYQINYYQSYYYQNELLYLLS